MTNIKDRQKYSPEIAAMFCGDIGESSHECKDGSTEHVCEEAINHTSSHRCGFCGYTWSEAGGCC